MERNCRRCETPFSVTGSPGWRYCVECRAAPCAVEGCGRPPIKRGYCMMHYSRVIRGDDAGPAASQIASNNGLCMIVGCEQAVSACSLCHMHYRRLLRTGELGPVERKRALVGSGIDHKGYRVLNVAGRQFKEHRLVMERVLGRPLRKDENVHHIDGDKSNNDPGNLELWVKTQPCGQRVSDRVRAAIRLLKDYPANVTREGYRLVALESAEACELLNDLAISTAARQTADATLGG